MCGGTLRIRILATLLSLPLCGVAVAEPIETRHLSVEYREAGGARVLFGGVPVIRGSSIQLHAPNWNDGYYSSSSSPRTIDVDGSGRQITVRHSDDRKGVRFVATETYRLIGEAKIEITLAGQVDTDLPTRMEWTIGYLNAFPFYGGRHSEAGQPGEQSRAVVPQAPRASENAAVASDTPTIRFESRLGAIVFHVEHSSPRLTLLDGRLAPERWWAQEAPTFWLGALNVEPTPGERFEYKAVVEFSPGTPPGPAKSSDLKVAVQRAERVYEPPQRPIRVIPKPKSMKLFDGRFTLTGASDGVSKLLAANVTRETDPNIKPEGYSIRCDAGGITVRASGDAGYRYATYTLEQLVRTEADGTPFIPHCLIDDEPSLAFRGVHIFPGKDSLELHRKLIENVIARHKFNHVVLECEYTRWDSARGIWVDFSVPKDQIRAYVKMLRDTGLEPIPLVQSLGHSGWMFKNDQNLDLAEDPEMPRAYDATNPKTYAFIDRIYEEAVELFQPIEYFHIGHDEITLFGRYPHREESKKWGVTKLFLSDIQHWKDFFDPRDVKIMIWGDMLLAKEEIHDGAAFGDSLEEAKQRRAALPKDIIICDWHYEGLPPEKYPSLRIFREAGFKTIASTWFNPVNIYGFAEAARREGAWGLLQTTWAGYNLDDEAVDKEAKQFAAYILAAEYAWSADSPPPTELPWRADEVLAEALDPREVVRAPQPGFTLAIEGNEPLDNWLDLGAAADLQGLKEIGRVDGVRVSTGGRASVLGGALLAKAANAAAHVSLDLGSVTANELAFLHVTAFPAELGDEVGRYEIHYADGSSERIPLRYGINIRAWDDPATARGAAGAWVGKNAAGMTVAARLLVWRNPHPDKPIERIRFATDHPYASPALFGISGIGGK